MNGWKFGLSSYWIPTIFQFLACSFCLYFMLLLWASFKSSVNINKFPCGLINKYSPVLCVEVEDLIMKRQRQSELEETVIDFALEENMWLSSEFLFFLFVCFFVCWREDTFPIFPFDPVHYIFNSKISNWR